MEERIIRTVMEDEDMLQGAIDRIRDAGGRVELSVGDHRIYRGLRIDSPCVRLSGGVWSYSSDPNGVFESYYGSKLRLMADVPAVEIGFTHTTEGLLLQDFGVQGNIDGMDTRPFLTESGTEGGTGLYFNHTRADQAEFSKLTFCGLGAAVKIDKGAEIDACTFEKLNTDGCAVGVWFSPRAAYYPSFRKILFADNPYYGFYADGTDTGLHNLQVIDNLFIRDGGAFTEEMAWEPAAVYWKNIDNSLIRDNLFDCIGTFWYFAERKAANAHHETVMRNTAGLIVRGNHNRIINNVFTNSGGDAIRIYGDGNVLHGNIADSDVIIEGRNNQVKDMIFTSESAHLYINGEIVPV